MEYCDVASLSSLAQTDAALAALVEQASKRCASGLVSCMLNNSPYSSWLAMLHDIVEFGCDEGRACVFDDGHLKLTTCIGMASGQYGDGLTVRCPIRASISLKYWTPTRKALVRRLRHMDLRGLARTNKVVTTEDDILVLLALYPKANDQPSVSIDNARQFADIAGYLDARNRSGVVLVHSRACFEKGNMAVGVMTSAQVCKAAATMGAKEHLLDASAAAASESAPLLWAAILASSPGVEG
jgi:hypothetical protein